MMKIVNQFSKKVIKNLVKTSSLTLIIACAPLLMFAQSASEEPILDIVGYLFEGSEKLKDCSAILFKGNDEVQRIEVKNNGKFEFELDRNGYYTITMSKEGYQSKRIAISTFVDDSYADNELFSFDASLFKEDKLKGVDTFFMDFPFTLISYNKEDGKFEYDKVYSKNMKEEYKRLKEEAKLVDN